jgi:hypothetical protein
MGRALWVVLLIGCGNSSSSGGVDAAGDGPHLAMQCMDLCDTVLACNGSVNPMCQTNCTSVYEHYRASFMDASVACFAHQCTKTQEMCTTEALPAAPHRTIDDTYRDACLSRRNECSGAFTDDHCSSLLFDDGAVQAAMTCLTRSCAEIESCLADAL